MSTSRRIFSIVFCGVEFLFDGRLSRALLEAVAHDRPRLDGAGRRQLVTVAEGALAREFEKLGVLQRQKHPGVVLERHQLPETDRIIALIGARMGRLPMRAQEPVDAADPAGETGDVAIEDGKFRQQQQEADVERPPEELGRGLDPGGKAGGGAVELVVLVDVARQDPFGRGEEVEVVGVALEVEVRAAGVVGGDGGEGEGGGGGLSLTRGFRQRGLGQRGRNCRRI